jgi:hypothetical protein
MRRFRRAVVPAMAGMALVAIGYIGPAAAQEADLNTRHRIEQLLLTLGVDPAEAVFQVGVRNYAGPDCPGPEWNCIPLDRPVVQIAQLDGTNTADCTPDENECMAVQAGKSGNNIARCTQNTNETPAAAQSCVIVQETETPKGSNHAVVHQVIHQNGGPTQEADQHVMVTQDSVGGRNLTNADQSIFQSTSDVELLAGVSTQDQEANQVSEVDQDSETGANLAEVNQAQDQRATAHVDGVIVQNQNDDPDGPDQTASFDQTSETGRIDNNLIQDIDQQVSAGSDPTMITQTQGSFSGGLDAKIFQDSAGVSRSFNDQNEDQDAVGEEDLDTVLVQNQTAPQRCCSDPAVDQTGNDDNLLDLEQTSVQTANEEFPNQITELEADCDSSGTCRVDQSATQNGETTTNSCEASSCDIVIFCAEGICTPSDDDEDIILT